MSYSGDAYAVERSAFEDRLAAYLMSSFPGIKIDRPGVDGSTLDVQFTGIIFDRLRTWIVNSDFRGSGIASTKLSKIRDGLTRQEGASPSRALLQVITDTLEPTPTHGFKTLGFPYTIITLDELDRQLLLNDALEWDSAAVVGIGHNSGARVGAVEALDRVVAMLTASNSAPEELSGSAYQRLLEDLEQGRLLLEQDQIRVRDLNAQVRGPLKFILKEMSAGVIRDLAVKALHALITFVFT